MGSPLDLGEPVWQVIAIVVFLIPGLTATWGLERLEGRSALPASERLLRAIAWSVLIYLAGSPWIVGVVRAIVRYQPPSTPELIIGGGILIFVAPLVLATLIAWGRRTRLLRRAMRFLTRLHSASSAWDFAFGQATYHFVRVRLRTGEFVGGIYGPESFAAAYPEAHDLFLEEAWLLDDRQTFVKPVDGSRGVLLNAESIERVEFLTMEGEDDG